MSAREPLIKIVSGALIALGLLLVVNPELVTNKPVPTDTFDAVERRIWWGLIIGLGVLLLCHRAVRPWLPTLAATAASMLFGLLVARLVGIALDGSVLKQWVYVGIEVVLLAVAWKWYVQLNRPPED